MTQFVIQKHTKGWSFHFDLMLKRGSVLKTWRINRSLLKNDVQAVWQLPDHRSKYLSYEGPLSRGRGRVAVWDKGLVRIKRWSDNLIVFKLYGKKIKGEYCLVLWPVPYVKTNRVGLGKTTKWLLRAV